MAATDISKGEVLAVAVLGCGQWGRNLVRVFTSLPEVRVAWIVDPDPVARALARELAPRASVVGHLDDTKHEFQAAVVCTPADDHPDHVERLLSLSKDVFVEKPLAMDAKTAADLVRKAGIESRILMVGHQLLYHPAFTELERQIEKGTIGKVVSIRCQRKGIIDWTREPNVLWSYGPHDVAMTMAIANQQPRRVEAKGETLDMNVKTVTDASLTLGFPSGITAEIRLSGTSSEKVRKLRVQGERGALEFDDSYPGGRLVLFRDRGESSKGEQLATDRAEPLAVECAHFVHCARERKTPRTGAQHALNVTRVLESRGRTVFVAT